MLCLSTITPGKNVLNKVSRRFYSIQKKKRTIIMTQTVDGIGEKGEEISVAAGFARNYLFPNNYAVLSSPETKSQYKEFYDVCIICF